VNENLERAKKRRNEGASERASDGVKRAAGRRKHAERKKKGKVYILVFNFAK
jgi:hypothetical protein